MSMPTESNLGENSLINLSKLRILVKTDTAYQYYIGPHDSESHKIHQIEVDASVEIPYNEPQHYLPEWSPKGRYLFVKERNKNFHIYDSLDNFKEIFFFDKECLLFHFPSEKYFCIFEKYVGGPNLFICSLDPVYIVFSLEVKKNISDIWPFFQFTNDDNYFCYNLNGTINLYQTKDTLLIASVPMEDFSSFTINPSINYQIGCFIKEKPGKPSEMQIFNLLTAKKVRFTRGFNASNCHYYWSGNGKSLLFKTEDEVDKTGHSYYGNTMLYLLNEYVQSRVMLDKVGPILDVCWNPNDRDFIVIGGTMPPQVAIFDFKGKKKHSFGEISRNRIFWSPHGRFVILAGLGNLPGDIDIYDYNSKELINSINCPYINDSVSWSADSRYFMVRSTFDKMKVGNQFTIYRYNGIPLQKISLGILNYAEWKPLDPTLFKDRPSSPSSSTQQITIAPSPKPQSNTYVPPHLRGDKSANVEKLSFVYVPQPKEDKKKPKKKPKNKKKKDTITEGGGIKEIPLPPKIE